MQQSYEEPVIKAKENEQQTVDKALGGGKEGKVGIPAHNDKLNGGVWGRGEGKDILDSI